MSQNQMSGPQVGQDVIYTLTAGTVYAGKIVAVSASTGLCEILTFQPGGTIGDRTSVSYDNTGVVSNSWRYPPRLTGI